MSEYNQYRPQNGFGMPMVVKNLLILNVILFVLKMVYTNGMFGTYLDLDQILGLHYPTAPDFKVWQIVTYMFMHGNFSHILFNMFALFMFGSRLEQYWGPKRFLTYYMVTGIGAAVVHFVVFYFTLLPEIQTYANGMAAAGIESYDSVMDEFLNLHVIIGASGAVFGLLLAYGMLFPNTELMLIFFPVPIKAKYFVIGYGLIELLSGLSNRPGDNVAHFAHLGGMLFGFILIKYWNKKYRNRFY